MFLLDPSEAVGQTTVPQCYLWEPTPTWNTEPTFAPFLKGHWGNMAAVPAADATFAKLQAWLADGRLDPGRIALLIQNFGIAWDGNHAAAPSDLLHPLDGFTIDPLSWPDQDNLADATWQPWMFNGRLRAKAWMTAYLNRLIDRCLAAQVPLPNHLHLDSELAVTACCSPNSVYLLKRAYEDPRWQSVPVPGYGNLTCADLYAQAVSEFGFAADLLDPTFGIDLAPGAWAGNPRNRKFMLWWDRLCHNAVAGAFNECVTEAIASVWQNRASELAGIPAPTVGNYNHFNVARTTSNQFGWYFDKDAAGAPLLTRSDTLGDIDNGDQGATRYHESSGRWFIRTGINRVGFFDSPVLYPCTESHRTFNPYFPPQVHFESQQEANLRRSRHAVESVLLTGSEDLDSLAPWVSSIGTWWSICSGCFPHQVNADEVRETLAMLRAKDVRTLLFWRDFDPDELSNFFEEFRGVYRDVFNPRLVMAGLKRGSCIHDGIKLAECLWFTLDRGDYAIATVTPDDGTIEMLLDYENLPHPDCLQALIVNVELTIAGTVGENGGRLRLFAEVAATGDWAELTPQDGIPAYTPDGHIRRQFVLANPDPALRWDSADSLWKIRLKVVTKDADSTMTQVDYDLVQVVAKTNPAFGGCSIWGFGGIVAGPPDENVLTAFNADFTYDNVVTPSDAAGFLSHYVAGTLGADHNNDGEVTDADLAEFIVDYAEELE